MQKIYQEIFELAAPFLAVRENRVHTEICFDYAVKLLKFYGGREEIVLPAIILHDVGWSALPEEKINLAFGRENFDIELNRIHEVEGARIAANILHQVSTREEDRAEICRIIENHDSGRNPTNLEEKLVKDADRLFRFNPRGFAFAIKYRCFDMPPKEYWKFLYNIKKQWLFTDYAKLMAIEELRKVKLQFFDGRQVQLNKK